MAEPTAEQTAGWLGLKVHGAWIRLDLGGGVAKSEHAGPKLDCLTGGVVLLVVCLYVVLATVSLSDVVADRIGKLLLLLLPSAFLLALTPRYHRHRERCRRRLAVGARSLVLVDGRRQAVVPWSAIVDVVHHDGRTELRLEGSSLHLPLTDAGRRVAQAAYEVVRCRRADEAVARTVPEGALSLAEDDPGDALELGLSRAESRDA